MRSSALIEILSGVESLTADDVATAKKKFKELVRAVGNGHGVKTVVTADRIEFARNLLDARVSRTTIMERLKACYGISREQGYRDIRAALKLCQKSKPFATRTDENKSSVDQSDELMAHEAH